MLYEDVFIPFLTERSIPNILPNKFVIGLKLSFAFDALINAVAILPDKVSLNSANDSFNILGNVASIAIFITSPRGLDVIADDTPIPFVALNIPLSPVGSAVDIFCFIILKYSAKFIAPLVVNISDVLTLESILLDFGVNTDFCKSNISFRILVCSCICSCCL